MFFAHLRTSITTITIYLNEATDYRATEITQHDFKNMVENYRKPKAQTQTQSPKKEKKKTRSTTKEPAASSKDVALAASPPLRFIEGLGTTLDEFASRCNEVVKAMSSNHTEYRKRMHAEFFIRLIATGGLTWNKDSKNRGRDYLLAATAAVLESHFVPMYRPELLKVSGGAKILRKELGDYLLSIAKSNYVEREADENMQVDDDDAPAPEHESVTQWVFADQLEVDSGPFKKQRLNAGAIQAKLDMSTSSAKEYDQNARMIQKIVKSDAVACFSPDAKKGTVETAAYIAMNALHIVSGMSCHYFEPGVLMNILRQITHLKMAREKFVKSGGLPEAFDFSKVKLPNPLDVPHASTPGVMEVLNFRVSNFVETRSNARPHGSHRIFTLFRR